MQRVGSGLGENLDAPVADLVELGGKRILIDANLADRRLGRQLPAGESVDVNLPAVRARRGAGQRGQFVRQLVGIVGQGIEVAAFEHDGVRVGAGLGAYRRPALVRDHHLLLGSLDRHLDVDVLGLACGDRELAQTRKARSRETRLDHVASRGKPAKLVAAGGVGGRVARILAVRGCNRHLRAGNQRARGVDDVAVQRSGRCRRGLGGACWSCCGAGCATAAAGAGLAGAACACAAAPGNPRFGANARASVKATKKAIK